MAWRIQARGYWKQRESYLPQHCLSYFRFHDCKWNSNSYFKAFVGLFDMGKNWWLQRAVRVGWKGLPGSFWQFAYIRLHWHTSLRHNLDYIYHSLHLGFYNRKVGSKKHYIISYLEFGWWNKFREDMCLRRMQFLRIISICN